MSSGLELVREEGNGIEMIEEGERNQRLRVIFCRVHPGQ